ncbi:2-hydroxyacid dehydrogenase [Nesterenkonia sp. AY15]|uniref:2-hydroxyacid dehydrogenase n=1 Tax=Nesterenkonia sp. AY15 TaxID=2901139 RepID=UPI001F4C6749|nr:2-hydroxyacid dehydrogenase [Nesterenkonia sp. AY15]MCH8570061.1 2-hydroxyacid dehydrogenase [Nesterenkonia sp. AY15]
MRVAVYSAKPYDEQFLTDANVAHGHELSFLETRLSPETLPLAAGAHAVCVFVNDDVGGPVLDGLSRLGVRNVMLRSAGFNNVDLKAAAKLGISVSRVPGYSPHAVAEHCVALVMSLNRQIHRAYNRVREGNFALNGLMGFDLHGRTVGVVGAGRIGTCFARIMLGFGCRVVVSDPHPSEECRRMGVEYLPLEEVLAHSDIVSLHLPLTPQTHHFIQAERLASMRDGVMLINTSRGALIDTSAVIDALKQGKIGYLGLDVYEEEEDLFFEDLSDEVLHDDEFSRLLTFPNVLITGHQAFFTRDAMTHIVTTTMENLTAAARGEVLNQITVDDLAE